MGDAVGGVVPASVPSVPEGAPSVSGAAPSVPGVAPSVPERAPSVPERAPSVPERAQRVEGRSAPEDLADVGLRGVHRAVYGPVRRGNALEDTVARLAQTIRLGVVAPGDSLPPERELAGLYGVSRDTVREAIRELSETGFLVARRGRYGGTFVADPLPQPRHPVQVEAADLEDALALRRVLEAGAAEAAAARSLSAAEREALWERHVAARAADAVEYRRRDTLLHLTVAELSGIPSLVALVAENRARINEWLDTFPLLPRNIAHSNAQHEELVVAILTGSPDAARTAVLDHLAGSEALLRGFLT